MCFLKWSWLLLLYYLDEMFFLIAFPKAHL
jgi:hypothetical protein